MSQSLIDTTMRTTQPYVRLSRTLIVALVAVATFGTTTARAQQEGARLVLSKSLAYNIFQKTLPIKFVSPGGGGTVVDIAFCGAGPGELSSKLLILAEPGAQPKLPKSLLRREDCNGTPAQILSRLKTTAPPTVVVATMKALWQDWNLRLTTTAAAPAVPSTNTAVLSNELNSGLVIATFSTRNMSSKLANGSSLSLDGQFAFAGDSMYIALVAAPASNPLPSSYVEEVQLAPPENLNVRLPVSLFNALSASQFGAQPFGLDPQGFGTLGLSSPTLSLSDATLHSTAIIRQGPGADYHLDIAWVGSDLAIDKITLSTQDASCPPGDSNCIFQNTLRSRLAASLSKTLTTKYHGYLLRPTDFTHGVDVTIFGSPLHLNIQGLKTDSVGQEIRFSNIMAVGVDPGH